MQLLRKPSKIKTTNDLGLKELDFDKDFETSSPYGKCLQSFSFEADVFEKGTYWTIYGSDKVKPFVTKFVPR
jgi:hypothetical protein